MGKITEILDNGVFLISQINNNVHSVCISLSFRIGSAYESDSERGITHLVEHLFFRRLADLPQQELYQQFNSIGAELIAKTYCDYVEFSVSIVPCFRMQAFQLMLKLFEIFTWDCDEIVAEKVIVKKQIANKVQSYSEWINSIYFQDTIYEHPIMANEAFIDTLSCDEINAWKNAYFSVNNACCVITGNYEDEDLLIWKKALSAISPHGKRQTILNALPKSFGKRTTTDQYHILGHNSSYSDVVILFDIDNSINYETIRLLVSVLGEGCNSLLSKYLREQYTLTDDVFIELNCFNGFKRLSVSFEVDNFDLNKSICVFFDVIKNIDKHITEKEFNSSIRFFTDNQLKDYDDISYLNHEYVISDFVIPTIISEPSEKKSAYEKISVSDLLECAKRVFAKNNFSVIIETDNDSDSLIDCIEHSWGKLECEC